jgi:hypothetical protein
VRKVLGAISAIVVLGLAPLPGAGAQEPGVYASVSQFAYATNIVHQGGHDYMYLVGADRNQVIGGKTRTTAFAKRVRCLTLERKRLKMIACAAFVFPKRIPDRAFEFDTLMDSASVRFKGKDGTTAMRWTGRGTPEPNAAPYADASYGAGAYGEVYRNARARGKILGQRYPKSRMGFSILIEGAMAEGYVGEDVSITPIEGGGYKVTALYRIPR